MRLPSYPVKGEPVTARWGRDVVDFLRSLVPTGCGLLLVKRGPGGTTYSVGRRLSGAGAGVAFSGYAFSPRGAKVSVDEEPTKPWVRYRSIGDAFSEELGPPPNPWPGGEVWYEKAETAGNIVVTRLG